MATSLTVAANADTSDQEYKTSGVDWVALDADNDKLIFSNGSTQVIDGADIPTQSELIQAGVILSGAEQVVPKYFIEDNGSNIIKEIHNMGNQDKRYVLAFDFDGATASEPVLELWDDSNLNTITGTTLGAGTPSSSWWRGITTTGATPGAGWALTGGFSRLAGSSDGNYLQLNDGNGALTAADILYCNLAIVIPASATAGGSANPVFAVKWLSN